MVKHRTLDRAKILAAAQQIVQETSFAALTFQTLAQALGIRSQSLYNYYPNVDAVIEDMGTQFMTTLHTQLTTALTGVSGQAALRTYAQLAHDYLGAHGTLVQLIYFVHRYPATSPFVQATGAVIDLLRRLVDTVELRHMTQAAYMQGLISAVMGFTVIEIMGFLPAATDEAQSFAELLTLFLDEVASG